MEPGRGEFGPVRVVWADAADPASGRWTEEALRPLGEQQVRRFGILRGGDARRFLVGRAMLADLIAELTGPADPGFTTTCERCGADHGRPRLERAPAAVSISYAGSLVAVAAARLADAAAVGVDVEAEPPAGGDDLVTVLGPLFAPAPAPDVEGWTLIEAALKADGRGVDVAFSEIDVRPRESGHPSGSRAVRLPGRSDDVVAARIPGPVGFVLSAAMVPAAAHP